MRTRGTPMTSESSICLPSGKHTKNDRTSPFFMGKSTISMAMFNSFLYVYQRVIIEGDVKKVFWHRHWYEKRWQNYRIEMVLAICFSGEFYMPGCLPIFLPISWKIQSVWRQKIIQVFGYNPPAWGILYRSMEQRQNLHSAGRKFRALICTCMSSIVELILQKHV